MDDVEGPHSVPVKPGQGPLGALHSWSQGWRRLKCCHLLERCEEVGGQAEEGPGQPTAQDHLEGGDDIGSVGKVKLVSIPGTGSVGRR